ncbi:hypothetical protein [Azospirillum endophyticum]
MHCPSRIAAGMSTSGFWGGFSECQVEWIQGARLEPRSGYRPAGPSQSTPPPGRRCPPPLARAVAARDGGGTGAGSLASQEACPSAMRAGTFPGIWEAGCNGSELDGSDGGAAGDGAAKACCRGWTGGSAGRAEATSRTAAPSESMSPLSAWASVYSFQAGAAGCRKRGASAAPSQEGRSSSDSGPVRVLSCRACSRISSRVVTANCRSGARTMGSAISSALSAAKRSRTVSTASSTPSRKVPASWASRSRSSRSAEISHACRNSWKPIPAPRGGADRRSRDEPKS